MKDVNIKVLENLSLFCHISGIITVYLGILVIFLDLFDKDFAHIQIGIFILVTGYAFVKISTKLSIVLSIEKEIEVGV